MRNDDIFIFKFAEHFRKIIDMHMVAGKSPVGMLIGNKGALSNQNFALGDII